MTPMADDSRSTYDYEVRGADYADLLERAHVLAVKFWGDHDYEITRINTSMGNLAARMDGTVEVMDYHAYISTVTQ